ncbi:MAG: response regulator [Noviherbaspirillum sp.]|nr:response regulator [Noviherbaspirillum sp.]
MHSSTQHRSVNDDSTRPPRPSAWSRYLPQILSGLVLCLSLLITYNLWKNAWQTLIDDSQASFDFRVRETAQRIEQRMATYEQVLRGAQGFWRAASEEAASDNFRLYVDALRLDERYPGIQGIAISRIVPKERLNEHVAAMRAKGYADYQIRPPGERAVYTSITQIEPFTGLNLRARGFDMFSEQVRRAAMERARDTGKAAVSGKVRLVQEVERNGQAGFLMYLPLYMSGAAADTMEARRASIIGWVYAPFRMNDLMQGLGGERSTDLRVRIFDDETMAEQAQLYDSLGAAANPARGPLFSTVQHLDIAGRPWTISIASGPGYESRIDSGRPAFIAVAGIGMSLLLSALVWLLATGRKRALHLAMRMTQQIKRSEAALRESYARLDAEQQHMKVILENSHDAFVAVDANDIITDWNVQAERTFGWSAAEAIGKRLADLVIPEEQRAAHTAGFRRFVSTGTGPVINNRIEVEALHRSGKRIPVELAIAAVREGAGYTANAFIRDISERKEAQRLEAARLRSLEEARRALQHAQKLEAVGKLTGGVAHDFNNVLQIIAGNLQLLQIYFGSEGQAGKRIESALSAVERGSKLSSQLLAFARRQPLQPVVVDLRRMIGDMDDLLRQALGGSVTVETIADDALWNTLVDPNQLENVILNLAFNSRDAMDGNGRFTIELANAVLDENYAATHPDVVAGEYVALAVSDTGSGMTPEVIEQAFEPFFSTKPEGRGTGLGLSMAYGFVKQSGGHIQIESEVGKGTTMRIYLPRSRSAEREMPTTPEGVASGGTETILVVEDDADVQGAVVATLTDLGYRVLKADDGESALDIVRRAAEDGETIDLLFTDVVMPGELRGPELAKAVREIVPGIAVLFTSGYTQDAMGHGGRIDPDINLLSKPYRQEQLARRIRHLLRERKK